VNHMLAMVTKVAQSICVRVKPMRRR
jgi:hypothetical protein